MAQSEGLPPSDMYNTISMYYSLEISSLAENIEHDVGFPSLWQWYHFE